MKKSFKLFLAVAIVFTVFGMTLPAQAASYPSKAIVAIVPFGPGGGNDILIRLIAKYISPELNGQALVVENKPGAGGQIGWTNLAKARADGYTVGATSLPSMILVKSLRQNVPFKMDDFQYICNFQVDPIIWAVSKDSNFKSAKDVVDFARDNPNKLNVAGDGPQSNVQLQHLIASKLLNIDTNFVPYNGSGPANTALIGNQVDLAVTTLSSALPHIASGRMVPLAVFYDKKLPGVENVTSKEVFGIDIPSAGMALRGVAAPKNMKAEDIATLEKAFEKVSKNKEFLAQAEALGLSIEFIGNEESNKLVKESTKLVEEYKSLF